jgi:hypothetical protein
MLHLDRAILASSARDQHTNTSSPGKMSSGDWILSAYIDKPGTDGGRPTRTDGDSDHPVAAHAAAGWPGPGGTNFMAIRRGSSKGSTGLGGY